MSRSSASTSGRASPAVAAEGAGEADEAGAEPPPQATRDWSVATTRAATGRTARFMTPSLRAAGRAGKARRDQLRLLLLRHLDDRALLALGAARCRRCGRRVGAVVDDGQAEALAQAAVDLLPDVLVVLQELARVLAALAHALAVEGVPGAGLLDDAVIDAEVQQVALLADALAVEDVELGLAEGRRDLVLHDLDLGPAAHDGVAVLQGSDAPDVEAHRGVELERAAAGRGFGVSEHHADLLAQLVDEDE